MRGTRGMVGNVIFCGMSPNIPLNVFKYSGEYCQTFRVMSLNILGNVAEHSAECPQTCRGISLNILGNVPKHSREFSQTFRRMSPNIPGNVPFTLMVENWSKLIHNGSLLCSIVDCLPCHLLC